MTKKTKAKKKKKNLHKKSKDLPKAPPGIKKGDTVAVIFPSRSLDQAQEKAAIDSIRSTGLFVAESPFRSKKHSFFSAPDEERAKEINWAFSQPGIKAVFCARGGYGVARALALLKPQDFKSWQLKALFGYSDITYFHLWLQNQKNWQSFHAPLVGMIDPKETVDFIEDVYALGSLPKQESWEEVQVLKNGEASGVLTGGNLSLLTSSGVAALPRRPMILAIEEVNEDYYRIDRMIRFLIDAGYSSFVKGIIVGSLHQCGKNDRHHFGEEELKKSFSALCNGPIWWGARFGHGLKRQRILPMGLRVQIKGNQLSYRGRILQKT